jgi:hypothetical protein
VILKIAFFQSRTLFPWCSQLVVQMIWLLENKLLSLQHEKIQNKEITI